MENYELLRICDFVSNCVRLRYTLCHRCDSPVFIHSSLVYEVKTDEGGDVGIDDNG